MCFYKWWKQRLRIGNKSNLLVQNNDNSLLVGNWELQSLDDPISRNEPLDDEETFQSILSMVKSGRCLLTIKRLFPNADGEIWVIRVSTPLTGIVETRFNLGEEIDELTTYRLRATSISIKPNLNKIVVLSKLKNGHVVELSREVYPSDPNKLITTVTVKNSRAVAIYKRIMNDHEK